MLRTLVEKSKEETIKLIYENVAVLIEIRKQRSRLLFVNDGKWHNITDTAREIAKQELIKIIMETNDAMISVQYQELDWIESFIYYANNALNVKKKQVALRFQLTDGPEVVEEYDMPVKHSSVFKIVVAAKEGKFDTIIYKEEVYKLVSYNRLFLGRKDRYVFLLTLNKMTERGWNL
ncbi:MAG: hypothetical protein WDA18_09670 [Candidatus Ratteibacteria bacterium]